MIHVGQALLLVVGELPIDDEIVRAAEVVVVDPRGVRPVQVDIGGHPGSGPFVRNVFGHAPNNSALILCWLAADDRPWWTERGGGTISGSQKSKGEFLMRPISRVGVALLAVAAAGAVAVDPAAAAPPPTQGQSVIVVMAGAPTAKTAQLSINGALSGAQDVHRMNLVNAVSATVTPQQEAQLRANPSVAEVVPDAKIPVIPPTQQSATEGTGTDQGPLPPGACAPKGGTQLDPEALSAINADSDVPGAKTARGLGATGAGVTIGDIAGSIDPNSTELVRPDGAHVITDYQDFTGEGSATRRRTSSPSSTTA